MLPPHSEEPKGQQGGLSWCPELVQPLATLCFPLSLGNPEQSADCRWLGEKWPIRGFHLMNLPQHMTCRSEQKVSGAAAGLDLAVEGVPSCSLPLEQ